ncbi:MAG: DUF2029 domain-containing protein [Chroococcidiopsidaceae cyanobacterium CP_BM_ER_R8_30]|nr:DUF2029 domain-containing protein [Chroococcidiopsidaceae cyanobacterium CP_BM_ER_R8_30]
MVKLRLNPGNDILNIFLIFAVIISVVGFVVDLENTLNYGGVDLRNRVVGARLLLNGIDPYYFKWHHGMPDLWLDPLVDPNWPVSRVTVPPTVLMVHATIAKLPYFTQRIIWFLLQWGFLLLTLSIFAKSTNSITKSKLIWIIGLLFFSGSYFWRLHVERGQIYIVYVFLLSYAYWLARKFKRNYIISGFWIGLTASLRPPVVLMFLPILLYRQWKLLIGSIIGLMSSLIFSFAFAGVKVWEKYFSALKVDEEVHSGLINIKDIGKYNADFPKQIEGMKTISKALRIPVPDTSIQNIFQQFGINFSFGILLAALCILLIFICLFLHKNRTHIRPHDMIFLSGMLMIIISEYFLPASRQTYCDVQWIIALSLIIIMSSTGVLLSSKLNVILLISLFSSIGFTWMPWFTLVSDMTMLLYTVPMFVLIVLNNKKINSEISPQNGLRYLHRQ